MLCASFDENLLPIFNVVVEKPLAYFFVHAVFLVKHLALSLWRLFVSQWKYQVLVLSGFIFSSFLYFFNCVLFVKPFNFVSRDVHVDPKVTFEPNFGRSDIKLREYFMVRR